MATGTELHLIMPGVCGPLADIDAVKHDPAMQHWIRTLSRAHCHSSSQGIQQVVTSLFNLTIEGDFPAAMLNLLAHGRYDPNLHYMCADPVHLQADLERAILTSSADLEINEQEAEELCGALNMHFQQDGFSFIRTTKDNWFVASEDSIQILTTPLNDAIGRNVNFILPQEKDSAFWKQMLTEAQMLMHSHNVNIHRESRGGHSINSLWFHGCGQLPGVSTCRVSSVCSNNDIFKGLARYVQCEYMPQMATVEEYLTYLHSGKANTVNVLHLAELEHLVNYTDVTLWLDKLADVVQHWVYPLLQAANKNDIRIFLHPCNERYYRFSKYDNLKFWRQKKLEQHVNSY